MKVFLITKDKTSVTLYSPSRVNLLLDIGKLLLNLEIVDLIAYGKNPDPSGELSEEDKMLTKELKTVLGMK